MISTRNRVRIELFASAVFVISAGVFFPLQVTVVVAFAFVVPSVYATALLRRLEPYRRNTAADDLKLIWRPLLSAGDVLNASAYRAEAQPLLRKARLWHALARLGGILSFLVAAMSIG